MFFHKPRIIFVILQLLIFFLLVLNFTNTNNFIVKIKKEKKSLIPSLNQIKLIDQSNLFVTPDPNVKNKFEWNYKNWFWENGKKGGLGGGGSGVGSTIEYTRNCRNILHKVIKKYNVKSMIDAPCG